MKHQRTGKLVGLLVSAVWSGDAPTELVVTQAIELVAREQSAGREGSVEINGVAFVPKGSTTDTDCAEHAYGDVQVYLQRNRCEELVRMRFESKADGKTAAIMVSVLRFQQSASATDLNQLADRPGSGAIVDPSAEGEAWPGEHKPFFESAAYASGREGNSLKLVQAVWIGAPSTPDDANLVKLASAALNLTAP